MGNVLKNSWWNLVNNCLVSARRYEEEASTVQRSPWDLWGRDPPRESRGPSERYEPSEKENNTVLKRLFNLDTHAFAPGVVNAKTKELVGLSSSMVLRCDDCVCYHLSKCHDLGVTTAEVFEIFSMANLIGDTIVIPPT